MFTFYCHGLNIHPFDGSMCHVTTSKKHRNFEPHLTNWPGQFWQVRCVGELCQQKPLSYSIVHGFNFQLSDLNLWQLWEWMLFKRNQPNPTRRQVWFASFSRAFFSFILVVCSVGRRLEGYNSHFCPKDGVCVSCVPGWRVGSLGLAGLDEMIACCAQVMLNACFTLAVSERLLFVDFLWGNLSEIPVIWASVFGRRDHTYRNVRNHKRSVLGKPFRVTFCMGVHLPGSAEQWKTTTSRQMLLLAQVAGFLIFVFGVIFTVVGTEPWQDEQLKIWWILEFSSFSKRDVWWNFCMCQMRFSLCTLRPLSYCTTGTEHDLRESFAFHARGNYIVFWRLQFLGN